MARVEADRLGIDPVLRACLFCRTRFPLNHTAPWLGVGERVAFDPRRGRLWLICTACGAWNLTPLETRWEALDELERVASDRRSRLLKQTANIALIEAGPMLIVRVGVSSLREEVWWRYGDVLRERRDRAANARTWGKIINALVSTSVIGIPLPNYRDPQWNVDRVRRRVYGRDAWPGTLSCARCGTVHHGIRFAESDELRLSRAPDGRIRLWRHCRHCGDAQDGGVALDGAPAEHVLRRVLSHQHFAGAPEAQLERAAALVSEAGSGAAFTERLATTGMYLDIMPIHQSLALEIAVNEERERSLLALEAAALESRWREEERIAAIVDGELS